MDLIHNTAKINLSTNEINIYQTPIEDVKQFLGGRGMNVLELYRELVEPSQIDPFDPENPLIFGNGLLTGTTAPNAARFNVTSLSPETKILGDANCGGFFGPAMRFSGFDRLIIIGKSEKPVYLYLENNQIEIKDAAHLWGLGTQATQQMIWDSEGENVETACIGPAGEHLVRMACIINKKKNSASRGGLGAVMGSKQLKAIVARGTGSIKVSHPSQFMTSILELKDYLNDSRVVQTLRSLGTPLLYQPSNTLGAIRTNNSQVTQFEDSLRAEEFHKFSKGAMACASCVVHCRHANAQGGEGPEYTAVGLLGANCGLKSANEVIVLNNMCNDLGLDISSTGTVIPWFIEMSQKNLLDGMYNGKLEFGNFGLIQSLLIQTSYRQGIGSLIAESTQFLELMGENKSLAKKLLIATKGLPQSDPHDCRYIKSFALGIGTASRGADHLRSRPTLEIFDLPKKMTQEIYGKDVNTSPTSYEDKGWIVATHESIYAVGDGLGICRFVTHSFNSPHLLKYSHFRDLVKFGVDLDIDNFREVGDRIINLERLFNIKCGIRREDDYPPPRYMEEPASAGVAKGHKIEREKYDLMLDEYYQTRGWSIDGFPNAMQVEEIEKIIEER
ncbi:MAG: aldehyde ferredoxin oxidoreductase family protein [Candidatus Heimdallarchaeota archaeon]|nr:aldehyde ferredoxin oxidoreductase family protein [Candidatus Heimdallarchaeota archaeon]